MPRQSREHPFLRKRREQLTPPQAQDVRIVQKGEKKGRFHRFVDWLDSWHITRLFQALGSFLLVLTLVGFYFEYEDRAQTRKVAAWQLLTTKAPGNSGKKEALEYLNSIGEVLRGIDLSSDKEQLGAYLMRTNLPSANLSKANMSKANLSEANLSEANLSKTNMSNSNMTNAFLYQTDLSNAYLSKVLLSNARLSKADLSGTYLGGADLSGADLSGADLSGADLSYADLSYADLSDAKLTDAELEGARLKGADLSGSNLTGAKWIGADLSGADLLDADLRGARWLLCSQLQTAENWHFTYRDKEFVCGKQILDPSKKNENWGQLYKMRYSQPYSFHFLPETTE